MFKRIYLDFNATSPLLPSVCQAMSDAADIFGNPSSIHEEGRKARAQIEKSRQNMANMLGVNPYRITFTSGGSEANALACADHGRLSEDAILFVGATEHASVREAYRQTTPHWIPVSSEGIIDILWLNDALRDARQVAPHGTIRVAIQLANSETGVIQPLATIAQCVHQHGAWLHCDAVQALGKIPLCLSSLGADSYAFSAHKIGGPKGIGALIFSTESAQKQCHSFMRAGGQERGYRGGTENIGGIIGFSHALTYAKHQWPENRETIQTLRNTFETFLKDTFRSVHIAGENAPRLPNTSLFLIPPIPSHTLLMALDLKGFALSSGSACSSGTVKDSAVLTAMGYDAQLRKNALRLSLGPTTTHEEILRLQSALLECTTLFKIQE
jgi:cysteine desulfurase